MKKPIIGIPLGDPAGIGPEITVRTFNARELHQICRPILVGDRLVVEKAMEITGLDLKIHTVDRVEQAVFRHGIIDLMDLGYIKDSFAFGQVDARCGLASFAYIQKVAELAMKREVDAIATTPINKESLRAANVPFIGHTEILAAITGVKDPLTMFEVNELRVFFLSRHVSLRQACDLVTYDRVLSCIRRCSQAMERLGVSGTLAVAGLNPHSGEHGLFGNEEVIAVEPAVRQAQSEGYQVVGPIGADSVFHQALLGKYAAVISLYHDQGHIATKTYDFERTISITNSMPFLRTSVDHGTAYDIAGKNLASPVSLMEAVRLAAKYAPNFLETADQSQTGL